MTTDFPMPTMIDAPVVPSRPPTKGQRTREEILNAAVRRASVHGLEVLSIGMLASELGMSKAGLVAHFGSKQALQLAAVESARGVVGREILQKALAASEGLAQFRAFIASYFDYLERRVLPGGCFFTAIAIEFDDQDGPVRELICKYTLQRNQMLESMLQRAQELGEIRAAVDVEQLAFALIALMQGAVMRFQLFKEVDALPRATRAIESALEDAQPR